MSTFIEMLEEMAKKESKVRAVLKRSLAFEPGAYPPAFPYVELRLGNDDGNWKRTVYYLVAGLWAQHFREGCGVGQNFPVVCGAFYEAKEKSPSIEKRFIALLDADEGQLAYRLRQMVTLLKEHTIDFDSLLKELISWNHQDKFVQIRWAKAFYRTDSISDNTTEHTNKKEN